MMNFYDRKEDEDWNQLIHFNDIHNWFKSIDRLPRFSRIDASGVTKDDRKVLIELKQRDKLYDDGIFIEPSKIEAFRLSSSTDNWVTLYFNFIGDEAYITNPLEHIDEMTSHMVSIFDKGDKKRKEVLRYNIPLKHFSKWTVE